MITFRQVATTITVGAGILLASAAITLVEESVHPVSEGKNYLEKKGYRNIEGGDPHWFNACGKSTMSCTYTVTDAKGKTSERNVCFGLLGPYFPIFGK